MPSFHISTFGCQMNVRDSAWLAAMLKNRDYTESDITHADVIILNTCSVRRKPEQKVVNELKRIRHFTGNNPDVLVAVLGCVAQQLGHNLTHNLPQVRLVAGGDQIASVPDCIGQLLQNPGERIILQAFNHAYVEREIMHEDFPSGTAYVNIMQGCNNFCSYCIVPFTRGKQKSRAMDAILEECRRHIEAGALEIVLLGQNVNAWGMDNGQEGFASLLLSVGRLPGLERLRFITPHPKDMDCRTVEAFADLPVLCPRLHLPLQAGSDRILTAMRRRYTRDGFISLVNSLREARPDMAFSTDLIVGFPGESEEDFSMTLEMVERCNFMASFSFCYSDRPGTRASLMPDKIPQDIQLKRLEKLQNLQELLGSRWLAGKVGSRATVLLQGPSRRAQDGQNWWQGQDEYGVSVNVIMGPGEHAGKLIAVNISEAKRHSLVGTMTTP